MKLMLFIKTPVIDLEGILGTDLEGILGTDERCVKGRGTQEEVCGKETVKQM